MLRKNKRERERAIWKGKLEIENAFYPPSLLLREVPCATRMPESHKVYQKQANVS